MGHGRDGATCEIHDSGDLDADGNPDKSFFRRGKGWECCYERSDTDALRRCPSDKARYCARITTSSRGYLPVSCCTIAKDFATC